MESIKKRENFEFDVVQRMPGYCSILLSPTQNPSRQLESFIMCGCRSGYIGSMVPLFVANAKSQKLPVAATLVLVFVVNGNKSKSSPPRTNAYGGRVTSVKA
jgi:hypothetical protein